MTREHLPALHRLLSEPDPPDLVGRGHRVTFEGIPERRAWILLPLLTRWAQHRHLGLDGDLPYRPAQIATAQSRPALGFIRRRA